MIVYFMLSGSFKYPYIASQSLLSEWVESGFQKIILVHTDRPILS